MKKLPLCTVLLLSISFTVSAEAKHKKHKSDEVVYVDQYGHRVSSSKHHSRTRTIYVVEHDRPVERVVYIDDDGRYYNEYDGRRVYVRDHYYESYPSRYYTSQGRRRLNITLPF